MLTHNLGYPRIGNNRELKKACEQYWAGKITAKELKTISDNIKLFNWKLQKDNGIDIIPSNDFSLYDHVLDMSYTLGAIPERYKALNNLSRYDLYFAMARGRQDKTTDITAMEMTKWFDTNYHYIVPEFYKGQQFSLSYKKIVDEFLLAKQNGIITKPVIIGPVSYLLLGKEKESGFNRFDLLEKLLHAYIEIIDELKSHGAEWIQFDEPFLVMDIDNTILNEIKSVYSVIRKNFPGLNILIATYFGAIGKNLNAALNLAVDALHVDLVRAPEQLNTIIDSVPDNMSLSLGIVDGRNIWKNDFHNSLEIISRAVDKIGSDRILLAPSCSLLHSPCDLSMETNDKVLKPEIKQWMSFAKQKLEEISTLKMLSTKEGYKSAADKFKENFIAVESRKISKEIHNEAIKSRVKNISDSDCSRISPFEIRKAKQKEKLHLPLFPSTTIGSFPQTEFVRKIRAQYKKGMIDNAVYTETIKKEIDNAIRIQEEIGLDVLVHGEFERNDMVEFFGELLDGITFTQNGWVQSYGSRCVKPPVIYGDISRQADMTVKWTKYAASKTQRPVKGMLTGPVTILQWSFVRDDQPRSVTAFQIALAIRDEVTALENSGTGIIQIDEPALREGLPLKKSDRKQYLDWAVKAFKIASSSVKDETQIHTHMCYSEFNDIVDAITAMDADVITIEASRSQMELLNSFTHFEYPNDIGPGVYDIHSPRIPSVDEIVSLIDKIAFYFPVKNIWINPDCGLKTRQWEETIASLKNMVEAARIVRSHIKQ